MDVKSDLKNIISENLAKVGSSIFIGKSLSIIDESAENKESLLAAADRVSKRIALFIDTDLATTVFDVLRLEIENRELTSGTRRKHVRVTMCNKVYVTYNETASELYTVNISAGGMYIKTTEPFPVGSKVLISLPLKAGSHMHLKGIVVNIKRDIGKQPPGMGIEFREVSDDELKRLRDFVKRAVAQDILQSRDETGIRPSLVNI
jgi:uncharacterized protein (TIGR02266 family)